MNNSSDGELFAGAARAVITPPVGGPMSGFAGRPDATGTHDDLIANAVVLRRGGPGGNAIAIVCCDLLFMPRTQVDRIRRAISAATAIRETDVLISTSHNHYGPVVDDRGETIVSSSAPQTTPYLENLANVLAGVVQSAERQLKPAVLRTGFSSAAIGINRREHTPDGIILGNNPDGPMNPRVAVLRIDGVDGSPIAALVNHACHGVSLSHECTEYSADFPGVLRDVLGSATGAEVLFVQGAAGDINPRYMSWTWDNPKRLGHLLAAEAMAAYFDAALDTSPAGELRAQERILELPELLPASQEAGEAELLEIEMQLEATADEGEAYWARTRRDRIRHGLAVLRGQASADIVKAPVSAVSLSSQIGVITAPGEVFTELGDEILDRSPFPFTIYSGYTNGSINYVPTRAAYEQGGYEVTHACQVAPGAGELLVAQSVALLREIHADQTASVHAGN
jgi:hypothetical protein